MPNITDFSAGNVVLRPSETGVEAFAAAGRRAGAFYSQQAEALSRAGAQIGRGLQQAGDAAVAYQDHQQINAGADHGATLFANLTDSWNKTASSADVHDPSTAQKWREEQLEPALQQFESGFTTQRSQDWANRYVNTLRQHFFTHTEAEMSRIAADSVTVATNNAVNKFSNTAVTDPTSVDTAIGLFRQNLDDVIAANPNLKGADAARIRLEVADKGVRQIVHAGALGAIMNAGDPEAAAATWAKKYPDYVSGTEELQFAKAAKVQSRANLAYSKQAEAYQRGIDRDNVEAARNDIWQRNVKTDAAGNVSINPQFFKEVIGLPAKYPKAPNATETAKTLLDWGEKIQKGERVTSDPQTVANLQDNLFSPDRPTTELDTIRAEAAGKLDHKFGNQLRALIKTRDSEPIHNPIFKAATDQAKAMIEGNTPGTKMISAGKYPAFMQQFLSEYLRQSRAGTLPANALDLSDDNSLISQMIKPYRLDMGASISANGGITVPAPPRPMPAPTPDQMTRAREELRRRLEDTAAPIPRASM